MLDKILSRGYLKEGEKDWNDIATRVSEFCGGKEMYLAMIEKKLIPASPFLINAGTKTPQLFSCISGNTLVYCRTGMKRMDEIIPGDEVLTHKNRFKRVTKIWSNGNKETIKLARGTKKRRKMNLVCTPDHKIMDVHSNWVNASDLTEAKSPELWISDFEFPVSFDMLPYTNGFRKSAIVDNGFVKFINTCPERSGVFDKQSVSCKQIINNSDDIAYLFGAYLSNGWINLKSNSLQLCINSDDNDTISRIVGIIDRNFGIHAKVYKSNHGNWSKVEISSYPITRFINDEFGIGFSNKRIPEWIASASNTYKQQLIDGMMLDGIYLDSGTGRLVLANPTLVYQMVLLTRSIGYKSNFTSDLMHTLSKHETSGMNFNRSDIIEQTVKIPGGITEVYDMEVEEDHSFVAGDFIVHNCFVLPVEDDIGSIFNFYAEASKIFKSSGGVGVNWSKLRPKGSPLSGGGETSGVISFMSIFNEIIETVKQGGVKKGAAMCCLNINHPETEDFIRIKLQENKFKNFNISPVITDDFMRRVHRGDTEALALFDLIVKCTWQSSEPGMLFVDAANRDASVPGIGIYDSTNPSLARDTLVLTTDGIFKIQNLEGKTFNVPVFNGTATATCRLSGNNKQLYAVKLRCGQVYYATAEHKWPVVNVKTGKITKKTTTELSKNDSLPINVESVSFGLKGTYDEGFLIGWNYGDGSITKRSDTEEIQYNFTISEEKAKNGIYDKVKNILTSITGSVYNPEMREKDGSKWYEINTTHSKLHQLFISYGFFGKDNGGIPFEIYNQMSDVFVRGFIDGIISSDGYVDDKNERIILVSSRKHIIDSISTILGFYGIIGSVKYRIENNVSFPNGKSYDRTYERYDLCYGSHASQKFRSIFSLSHKSKSHALMKFRKTKRSEHSKYTKISCIEITDRFEDVWDLSVNDNDHIFKLSHCITGNCGERWLLPYECCCLCGLNLVPFVKAKTVDYEALERAVRVGIRFLDKAIDKNHYPLPAIEKASKLTRRLGLYPLGVADILIEAGLGYNTKEGRSFVEDIWKFINTIAWDESVKLGKKYGTFPAYEHRNKNLVPDDARNAAVTCVAPAGTTSFIAGANYGIEPFSSFVSERRNGAGEGLIIVPQFEQMLDQVCPDKKEEAINHVLKTGSITDLSYIPDFVKKIFVSAYMIHWKDHIDMMAMFQKHCVDGSISKTVNLPETATIEDIAEAYMHAWKSKCKGITFYREGTRDAVYNLKKEVVKKTGPDYVVPKKAPAIRYNVVVGCGKMSIIVVGDPETYEPIEVWIMPVSGGGCAGHCSGEGRAISNSLQFGFPPERFTSSFSKVVCKACANKEALDGKSCPDATGKKILEFIKDAPEIFNHIKQELAVVVVDSNLCPKCGTKLDHEGGCKSCPNPDCDYSRCS